MWVACQNASMPMRIKVANISVLAISYSPDKTKHTSIKSLAKQKDIGSRFLFLLSKKCTPLHALWNIYTRKTECCWGQVHETDRAITCRSWKTRCHLCQFFRILNDHRNVCSRIVNISLCSRKNSTVIGIVNHNRILTETCIVQFCKPVTNLFVHCSKNIEIRYPIISNLWRVRKKRW